MRFDFLPRFWSSSVEKLFVIKNPEAKLNFSLELMHDERPTGREIFFFSFFFGGDDEILVEIFNCINK